MAANNADPELADTVRSTMLRANAFASDGEPATPVARTSEIRGLRHASNRQTGTRIIVATSDTGLTQSTLMQVTPLSLTRGALPQATPLNVAIHISNSPRPFVGAAAVVAMAIQSTLMRNTLGGASPTGLVSLTRAVASEVCP